MPVEEGVSEEGPTRKAQCGCVWEVEERGEGLVERAM